MKKELTLTLVLALGLLAVSLGGRQLLLKPAGKPFDYGFAVALAVAAAALLAVFAVVLRRLWPTLRRPRS